MGFKGVLKIGGCGRQPCGTGTKAVREGCSRKQLSRVDGGMAGAGERSWWHRDRVGT